MLTLLCKNSNYSQGLVAHAFNASTGEAEAGRSFLVQDLTNRSSARTGSKVTQKNCVSQTHTHKKIK